MGITDSYILSIGSSQINNRIHPVNIEKESNEKIKEKKASPCKTSHKGLPEKIQDALLNMNFAINIK